MMNRIVHELESRGYSPGMAERARNMPLGGLSKAEAALYKWSNHVRTLMLPDSTRGQFESEIAVHLASRGFLPDGQSVVPLQGFFRDFNTGASQATPLIDGGRTQLAYQQGALRAGALFSTLPVPIVTGFEGGGKIPRWVTAPAGAATAEVGAAADGSATTAAHVLTPRLATAKVRVSLQAALQGNEAVLEGARRELASGVTSEIERQFISGTGAYDEATGLRFASGVQQVAAGDPNGGQLTFAKLADVESVVHDGVEANASGWVVNKTTRRWLRTLPRGTGLAYTWDGGPLPLLGHPAAVSTALPNSLTKGTGTNLSCLAFGSDWTLALVAIFGEGVGVTVDRFSMAPQGQVKITANVYFDIVFLQPAAFAHCSDAATV